jgi:hypothetical protein
MNDSAPPIQADDSESSHGLMMMTRTVILVHRVRVNMMTAMESVYGMISHSQQDGNNGSVLLFHVDESERLDDDDNDSRSDPSQHVHGDLRVKRVLGTGTTMAQIVLSRIRESQGDMNFSVPSIQVE